MSTTLFKYQPDYAVPPGVTLQEAIDSLGMSQAELARRMGRPVQAINEIIKGKKEIEPETALQLERVLGTPASFWNNRESQYRDALLRIAETRDLEKNKPWLKQFPWNEMVETGYVAPADGVADKVRALLSFFGAADVESCESQWQVCEVSFRRSAAFDSHRGALMAWLRLGEIRAEQIQCAPYRADSFLSVIKEVRTLTQMVPREFAPQLQKLCANVGVAVVFIRELTGGRESGAARWLTKDKAMIQLSLRFKTDDHFWFSFFHEAAHICLHQKRKAFIDDLASSSSDPEEAEADAFARDALIPPSHWQAFTANRDFTLSRVREFAVQQGIAPGVVVGRLMHEKLMPWNWAGGHHLRRKFVWATSRA